MSKGKVLAVYLAVFLTVFSVCLLGDYLSKWDTWKENHTSTVINKHVTHYQEYHCPTRDENGVCTNTYYTEGTYYWLDLQDGTKQKVEDVQYSSTKIGDSWSYTDTHTALKPGESATPRRWTIVPPVIAVGLCALFVVVSDYKEKARRARLKEHLERRRKDMEEDDENPLHLPLIKQHKYTREEIIEMAPRPDNVNPRWLKKSEEPKFFCTGSGGIIADTRTVDLTPKEPIFVACKVAGPSGVPKDEKKFVPPQTPIPKSVEDDELIS